MARIGLPLAECPIVSTCTAARAMPPPQATTPAPSRTVTTTAASARLAMPATGRSMASSSWCLSPGMNPCMAELVSWFLIEPGWSVLDRSGAEIGAVTVVVGDEDMDIFDGIRIATEDEERYVPGDRVGPIEEGTVTVQATLDDLEPTPAGDEPGGVER